MYKWLILKYDLSQVRNLIDIQYIWIGLNSLNIYYEYLNKVDIEKL